MKKQNKYITNISNVSLKTVGEEKLYQEFKTFAKNRGQKLYFILRNALIEYMENHKEDKQ